MATISNFVPWDEFHRQVDVDAHSFDRQDSSGFKLQRFLDEVAKRIRQPSSSDEEVTETMDRLFDTLLEVRRKATSAEWQETIHVCRRHPLRDLVHEDPFTFRAFSKPREYAGDAVMMDYIYGREELWPTPPASRIGQRVFEYTTSAPASEGVRARRGFIADVLDNLVHQVNAPDVLAIASGHLREASMSAAVRRRHFGRFLALDVDRLSLEEVERCYAAYGIETVPASFRRLITGQVALGRFDLIYSTGLFDYLKQPIARRLTNIAFGMLRSGGKLILANFVPNIRDIGYMEAFMDWELIYRNRQDMVGLTAEIPDELIGDVRLIAVENRNIVIIEITRD